LQGGDHAYAQDLSGPAAGISSGLVGAGGSAGWTATSTPGCQRRNSRGHWWSS